MSISVLPPLRFRPLPLAMGGLTVLLVLIRFLPDTFMASGGTLDDGWTYGINVAAKTGLVFGRDLIFTYGPYGAVATRLWNPGLTGMIVGGDLILGLAFAAGVLAHGRPALALLTVLALPMVRSMDALTLALALPALLLCAQAVPGRGLRGPTRLALLALAPALGLLPLVKGSASIGSALSLGLIVVLLLRAGHWRWAIGLPVLTAVFLCGLWCAAGQPLGGLAAYFGHTGLVIAGYNDAMANPGPPGDVVRAAVSGIAVLAVLGWGARRIGWRTALPLLAGVAALVFLVFKAGFVRQDQGHEYITFCTFGVMLLMMGLWLGRFSGLAACGAGLWMLAAPLAGSGPGEAARAWYLAQMGEVSGCLRLATDPAGLAAEYGAQLAGVSRLPWAPKGTADIYSFGQMQLFATGLAWLPRPVFQSYSAYSPHLAALNLRHLTSASAPENIFFRPEPIDDRYPALEDGLSWPALLSLYEPAGYDAASGLAWLRHKPAGAQLAIPGAPTLNADPALGETVMLPGGPEGVWASIDVRPTYSGQAAGLLWQAPVLHLRLDFSDGKPEYFRIVPGMAKAGFLLSPFVETTLGFLRLRSPDGAAPGGRRPISVSVETAPHGGWAWRRRYHLTVSQIRFPPLSAPGPLSGIGPQTPVTLAPAERALCFMDEIDAQPVTSQPFAASAPVRMMGWAVFDAKAGVPAEKIDVAFQGADGRAVAMPAMPVTRIDVAGIYHLPAADKAGFMVEADLSVLAPGIYTVWALPHHGGLVHACRTALTVKVPPRP